MDHPLERTPKGDPIYRFELRGKIATAGFRTVGDFALAIGVDPARVSRIICGWELPNAKIRAAMAEKLNLSIDDFLKLL